MLQILLFLVVSTFAQEETEEEILSRKIGACWIKTIKDINNEKESMTQIIESVENGNKTSIFHKIQMQMILSCVQVIDVNSEILSSLAYKEVVKDFNYKQFIGMDVTLTKEEEALLKIIKKLEKDLGEMDKKNKLKQSYQQTQKVETEWQNAWKEQSQESSLLSKPNYFHYAFFLVLIVAIFGGGYWSLKSIQAMNNQKNSKQRKRN
ncbi:unnamed protein product (macronuclear) [Paramecium tetraurelia]|uniref:Transmembrane protein n=1 Tax=Paramecium tetraurelia TaxID=5888 RepID=A0DVN0_PARTE|nr:uncharacterized protein GSPATT00020750001 [Paramecium tetraurelia]CAK87097.1 unnamed protein product [Paramecium tetraurelia]|eukprot:XP_001454494.1 hypothetical protein (macronuclear) [Paramecium tetraurelia strain d4-2]